MPRPPENAKRPPSPNACGEKIHPQSILQSESKFQQWLLKVLEDHRQQSVQDIKMQFASPLSRSGEGDRFSSTYARNSLSPLAAMQNAPSRSVKSARRSSFDSEMPIHAVSRASSDLSGSIDPEMRAIINDVKVTIRKSQARLSLMCKNRSEKSKLSSEADLSEMPTEDGTMSEATLEGGGSVQADEAMPGFLSRDIIGSPVFDSVVGLLIIANTIVIIVQLEWRGHLQAISLGNANADNSWPNAKIWFDTLEHVFNVFFLIELILRLIVFKMAFFKHWEHLFDAFIVIVTSVQAYVLDPIIGSEGGGSSIVLIRMVRYVRFVRILRVVRTLTLFHELRVLIATWIVSFRALVTSMILLAVLMMMGGLMLCQMLEDFVMESKNAETTRRWVHNYYGSGGRSMYTMFEATLSGCWPNYFRPLIEDVSGWFALYVIVYICIVVFGFIRIITALFLKQTLAIANDDATMRVNETMKSKKMLIARLHHLFRALDVSGDGKLSIEEFEKITANDKVKVWLQTLELDVHDVQLLFDIMDDGDGMVTSDEFLNGILRLKGHGRAFDIVNIMRANDWMKERLVQIMGTLDEMQANSKGGADSSPKAKDIGKKVTLEAQHNSVGKGSCSETGVASKPVILATAAHLG